MDLKSGRILLSGASGMLGTALRRGISARQLECLQLARPARAQRQGQKDVAANPPAPGSRTFRSVAVSISGEVLWDPLVTPSIFHPELLEGLDAAIHLCGANVAAHRWTPEYKREIVLSRVDSTRALAATLAGLSRPPKALIVASAAGFYGNRGDELLDESSAHGSGFLADLCRQWEEAVQAAIAAGIRVVQLRTGVVLGPRNGPSPGALDRLLPIFRLGLGGRLGPGKQWMSWISQDDFVSAVFFLMGEDSISGPVNLTAPNPTTNAQFTRALARAVHRPAVLPVPAWALRGITGEMADEALLASARVVPARLTAAGFQFAHPTIDAALAAALAKR
jgi:uncharacterized protein